MIKIKDSVKTVTYNGEDIYFYAQGTTLNDLAKGQKHTLTMYYMERGMWESNMAVAFNFPDNNELQVQKEVDLKNVTDDDIQRTALKSRKSSTSPSRTRQPIMEQHRPLARMKAKIRPNM